MKHKHIKDSGGLVFSTERGKLCPKCQQPLTACICQNLAATKIPEGDGTIRIRRETKGRKGAGVTLLCDICLNQNDLKVLAKDLKKKCGSGGSIKDGRIELQGDVREQAKNILEKKGFRVKICGG